MISVQPIFDRKMRLDKTGKGVIDLRITLKRKPHYFFTGLKVYPLHWDKNTGRVNNKCPDAADMNRMISDLLEQIDSYAVLKLKNSQEPQYDELRDILKPKKFDPQSFIAYAEREINDRVDLKERSRSGHLSQLERVKEYCPNGLQFAQLDYTWIESFDRYLSNEGLNTNTRWKYHKFIKTYINSAIKKGIISSNPYANFKVIRSGGNREALTLQELKLLENLDRSKINASEQISLDKFLFSCYSGLRISDIEHLRLENFKSDGDGLYLTIKMEKTSTVIRNMALHKLFNGKAVEIYNKYAKNSSWNSSLLFPELHRNEINKQLKVIATVVDIEKQISFHMARHTFGSALAELTGNVMLIKTLMGHSKVETSMIYIHMSRQRIENMLDQFNFDY